MRRALSPFFIIVFCLNSFCAYPLDLSGLPQPGTLLLSRETGSLPVLRGLKLDAQDPLHLEFIVDTIPGQKFDRAQADELVKYFFAALTIPSKDLWVNLSPYEKDKVMSDNLSYTALGKAMLKQDYILKQVAASLTYPETESGKKYWKTVGAVARYRSDLSKVWITSKEAEVYEDTNSVVITKATLKAFTRGDSPAMQTILPIIEQDLNAGKNFANLRQIYNAMVLAVWFKQKFKESFFKAYINKQKISGITLEDKNVKEKIYDLYVEAFKKGSYKVSQKEKTKSQNFGFKIAKSNYFSGGMTKALELEGHIAVTFMPPHKEITKKAAVSIRPGIQTNDDLAWAMGLLRAGTLEEDDRRMDKILAAVWASLKHNLDLAGKHPVEDYDYRGIGVLVSLAHLSEGTYVRREPSELKVKLSKELEGIGAFRYGDDWPDAAALKSVNSLIAGLEGWAKGKVDSVALTQLVRDTNLDIFTHIDEAGQSRLIAACDKQGLPRPFGLRAADLAHSVLYDAGIITDAQQFVALAQKVIEAIGHERLEVNITGLKIPGLKQEHTWQAKLLSDARYALGAFDRLLRYREVRALNLSMDDILRARDEAKARNAQSAALIGSGAVPLIERVREGVDLGVIYRDFLIAHFDDAAGNDADTVMIKKALDDLLCFPYFGQDSEDIIGYMRAKAGEVKDKSLQDAFKYALIVLEFKKILWQRIDTELHKTYCGLDGLTSVQRGRVIWWTMVHHAAWLGSRRHIEAAGAYPWAALCQDAKLDRRYDLFWIFDKAARAPSVREERMLEDIYRVTYEGMNFSKLRKAFEEDPWAAAQEIASITNLRVTGVNISKTGRAFKKFKPDSANMHRHYKNIGEVHIFLGSDTSLVLEFNTGRMYVNHQHGYRVLGDELYWIVDSLARKSVFSVNKSAGKTLGGIAWESLEAKANSRGRFYFTRIPDPALLEQTMAKGQYLLDVIDSQ